MRATYRNRSGRLTPEENQAISDYEAEHGLWLADRPTLAQDRDGCVALHVARGCRWWRAGEGMLSGGTWVESPVLVLERMERER